MEASVAGEAAGQGEAQEGQEAQQAAAFDPAPLLEGFEAMRGELEGFRTQFEQGQQGAGEAAGEQEGEDDFDLSWLEDAATGALTPEVLQQNMQQLIEQARAEGAKAAQPALDAVSEMRIQQQAAALAQEFPAITEPETAENVMQGSAELASVIAREMGLPAQTAEALAGSPALWRVVYLAANAAETAQRQDQGSGAEHAHLESGGARPAGQQVDLAQQIETSGRTSVLPWP